MIKEKKSTWQKSRRERLKREQEVLCLAEETKTQGIVDEKRRAVIVRALKLIKKLREEEETWNELLEEEQDKKKATRRRNVEGTRRLHGLLGPWEKKNEYFVHKNLANDPKQPDKDGEFGKPLHGTFNEKQGTSVCLMKRATQWPGSNRLQTVSHKRTRSQ